MRPLLMMMTREQVISTSGKMWVDSKDRVMAAQVLDEFTHLTDLIRIQTDGRLVKDEQLGLMDHRVGKPDALSKALR